MIDKIKFVFIVSLLTLLNITILSAQQQENSDRITLAVMDFKNNSSIFGYDRLERAIPEMLKTELSRSSEIVVVERSKIESILAEQALVQSGVIENHKAQEIGRLAGAEYIITGEINTVKNHLRIDAHLLKVATGQVIGEKVTGKDPDRLEPMMQLLAENLIFNLTGKGVRKVFMQIHNYGSKWGLMSTGALSVAMAILHFQYKDSYAKYHETDQLNKFDPYYNDANKYYKARNVMLAITGTAALTTFILWQKDRSAANKIYASADKSSPDRISPRFAVGFAMQSRDYLLSLSLSF